MTFYIIHEDKGDMSRDTKQNSIKTKSQVLHLEKKQ